MLVTPPDTLQGGNRQDVAAIRGGHAGEPWYEDAAEAAEVIVTAPQSQQATLERAMRPFFYGRWDERTQEHAATADHQISKRALLGFGAGVEPADIVAMVAGLKDVTAPVLVVGGERDGATGVESVHRVAGCFPAATTVVVPRAGHFPWVDEPTAFRAAVSGLLVKDPGLPRTVVT